MKFYALNRSVSAEQIESLIDSESTFIVRASEKFMSTGFNGFDKILKRPYTLCTYFSNKNKPAANRKIKGYIFPEEPWLFWTLYQLKSDIEDFLNEQLIIITKKQRIRMTTKTPGQQLKIINDNIKRFYPEWYI